MKQYSIRYSDEAISDLWNIHDYLAGVIGELVADKIRRRIMEDIRVLQTMPERTPAYSEMPNQSVELRRHLAAKHYHVFLTVDHENLIVFIVRIFFASASYEAALAEFIAEN